MDDTKPGGINYFSKRLVQWAVKQKRFIIDPSTSVQKEQLLTLAMRTLRYRAAGLEFPLTANEQRLLSFRNKHRGRRVFIIGNGPSLNKCDLTMLKNEITIGVNGIFLNYENMGFHPTYYVVEDVFVAEDRAARIKTYEGPTKFFGNYLRYCLDGSSDAIWLNVRVGCQEYPGFPHFAQNLARIVWVGGTVSYICLQLAFYMGFSEVYLIGFDHNYTIPSDAIVSNLRETGSDILSTSADLNHFHPDYFGKGYRWHDPKVERMEKAYCRAREFFEADGRVIRNATVGGKLEVFERVTYTDLF